VTSSPALFQMNPKEQIPMPDETLEELDMDSTSSVDDFIKELEAKEKDLHITADMTIEISESEYDPRNISGFVPLDTAPVQPGLRSSAPAGIQVPGLKTRVFELEKEVETLQNRVASLRAERNDVQDKSDRRLKDFENYKYRMDRERRGAFIDQISNLASQMLPVLDNLDRALGSLEKMNGEKSVEFQQFYDGIALVNQQVNEVFSEMGVQPIATVGEAFDPNFHEAVATEERDDMPGKTGSEGMLRGYRIGNRVIRHSMVRVTIGQSTPAPSTSDLESLSVSPDDLAPVSSPNNELPDLDPESNGEEQ